MVRYNCTVRSLERLMISFFYAIARRVGLEEMNDFATPRQNIWVSTFQTSIIMMRTFCVISCHPRGNIGAGSLIQQNSIITGINYVGYTIQHGIIHTLSRDNKYFPPQDAAQSSGEQPTSLGSLTVGAPEE